MKFDYTKTFSNSNIFFPEYHFKFVINEYEIRDICNRHGKSSSWVDDTLYFGGCDKIKKYVASFLIMQSMGPIENNLNVVDYKVKYQELVDLLEPHKIDDSMSPATTLKMLLKYNK
jgi:hypothetical protein